MDSVVNWPSGLRRQFKALVRKGVGSNPTLANSFFGLSPTPAFRLSCEAHAVHSPVLFQPDRCTNYRLLAQRPATTTTLDVNLCQIHVGVQEGCSQL
ncbi:hypothetical protein DD237_008267 [Peronospora effusa]|uniref:Uncharacterized protein n=1 Tax=Peronospora effusa TaxID=542832 RepID=A0A3R7XMJ3_9STRA|nr:hypothetical protein DD237_008267 [Peronospora effusa]